MPNEIEETPSTPPAAPEAPAAPPPPAGPSLEQRFAELAAANQRLAAQNEVLMEVGSRAPVQHAPQEPEEELDEGALKAAARVATRALEPVNGQLSSIQQQLDALQFRNTVLEAGIEAKTAEAAGQQFMAWRKNGTKIVDARTGEAKLPTARDAIAFALGRELLEGNVAAAPKRNLEALRTSLGGALGVEGAGGAAPRKASGGSEEWDKLPRKERLAKLEASLADVEM